MAGSRVILAIVSVNKVVEKQAKRVKGYLRLRGFVQLKQTRGAWFLLRPPDGLFGDFRGSPSLFGSLMVIFGFLEVRFSLRKNNIVEFTQ